MPAQETNKDDPVYAPVNNSDGAPTVQVEDTPEMAGSEEDNIDAPEEKEPPASKGPTTHNCPYPGCDFTTQRIQALGGHMRFVHETRGEKLPAPQVVGAAPATPVPGGAPPAAQQTPPSKTVFLPVHKSSERGSQMQQRVPSKMPESMPTEIGKKAEVRGRVKQVLKIIAGLEPEKAELLAPQREMCIEYIKALNKAEVSEETLGEIESSLDSVIKPEVRGVIEGPSKSPPPKPSLQTGIVNMTRVANMRGKVKKAIADYFKLSTSRKEDLASEKEVLVVMSQKLSSSDLTQKDLEEYEAYFDSEIVSAIAQALQAEFRKAPVSPHKSGEDLIENEIAARDQELKLERMDRMLEEEKLRRKQNMMALQNVGGQSNSLVPVLTPKMNSNGELVRDETGAVVMETKYTPVDQSKGSNDLIMAMLLSGKLGKGDDSANDIFKVMMTNNTAILTALIESKNKNSGPSAEESMLKMQNEQMKFMMLLEEKREGKGEDPNIKAMRDELRANREEASRMREAMYTQQLGYVNKEMDDLKHYAYRDPLEDIKKKREQLEELGIIPSKERDAEADALKESSKIMQQGIAKLDTFSSDAKTLLAPLVKAQATALERQSGGGAPLQKSATEQEKVAVYRDMLNNLEEEGDEEGGE